MTIRIKVGPITLTAELNDSPTAQAMEKGLPFDGSACVWGEEIYFEIPLSLPLADDAVEDVDIGTLAYWPTGRAFCIFFGPTPVSTGQKPRAYSPVNVFGHVIGDAALLKTVNSGSKVRVARIID